jgi:hypothetical protein
MNLIREGWKDGKCKRCGLKRTEKRHDPCIANLPGVVFACCGHGENQGYVAFENGVVIRGHFETTLLDEGHLDAWRKNR